MIFGSYIIERMFSLRSLSFGGILMDFLVLSCSEQNELFCDYLRPQLMYWAVFFSFFFFFFFKLCWKTCSHDAREKLRLANRPHRGAFKSHLPPPPWVFSSRLLRYAKTTIFSCLRRQWICIFFVGKKSNPGSSSRNVLHPRSENIFL